MSSLAPKPIDPKLLALKIGLGANLNAARRDQNGEYFFPVIVVPAEEKKNPRHGPPYPHRRYS